MPKNRGPGGKGRKKAKGAGARRNEPLLLAEAADPNDALYAFVREACGSGHYRLACNDGKDRLGVLRGSMVRRVWVRRNDMVLVTKRSYQDGKADIVHKYAGDEVLRLMAMGEISAGLSRLYNSFDGGGGGEPAAGCEDEEDTVVFDEDAI